MKDEMAELIIKDARKWMQWNCRNGEDITWGSEDVLVPHMTARTLEKFALSITSRLRSQVQILKRQVERLERRNGKNIQFG